MFQQGMLIKMNLRKAKMLILNQVKMLKSVLDMNKITKLFLGELSKKWESYLRMVLHQNLGKAY